MESHRFVCCAVSMVMVTLFFLQCFTSSSASRDGQVRSAPSPSSLLSSSSSSSRNRGGRGGGGGRGRGSAPSATPRSSAAQTRSQEREELPYYMLCPEVHCPEVPSTCQTVEYLVYEYQYEVRGKGLVTVRCQSCDYCLDAPSHLLAEREIRSFEEPIQVAIDESPCSSARCPTLRESCIDVRPISVFVGGQRCGQCPACYDGHIINIY